MESTVTSSMFVPGALWLIVMACATPSSSGQEKPLVKGGASICFLGDSITSAGARNAAGYCRLVIEGLKVNGVEAKLIPAGVSGHKSDQMLARLQRDVIDKKPDWMTLSCGVNDVWHGDRGISLPQYKKNITDIVTRAQEAGIKVMILTATMIKEDQSLPNNQKLAAYNGFLRELAAERSCVLADLNQRMQAAVSAAGDRRQGNQLTTDGVHMNTFGNMMMAEGVLSAFRLSPAQMAKAVSHWESMPRTCSVRLQLNLTAAEFRKLKVLADEKGVSVDALFRSQMEARARELIDG